MSKRISTAGWSREDHARARETAAQERAAHARRCATDYLPGIPDSLTGDVYDLAWEHGHASGFSDVENHYQDFAGLTLAAYAQGLRDGADR